MCVCALLLSKGHYLCRMSSTQKQTNMLFCVRGLSGPCSTETLLVNFIFASSFLSRASCPCLAVKLDHSAKTRAGARLCCGTPRTRMPEKYRPGDHSSTFCCTYPGNIENYFFFFCHIEWFTDIDPTAGKKVVNMLQDLEKPDCLVRWEWSELWKTTGCWATTSCTLLQPAW